MTFGDLIDRLFREWLELADEQPAQAPTSSFLSAAGSSVALDDVLTPEEAGRLAVGTIIEMDRELMMPMSYDASSRTIGSLRRGLMGTEAADHAAGTAAKIAPRFTRQTAFDSLGDVIEAMWPDLWQTKQAEAIRFNSQYFLLQDPLATQVLAAWTIDGSSWRQVQATIEPQMPVFTDGVPVSAVTNGRLMLTYKARLTRPTDETTTFAEIGADESWTQIFLLGAAAQVLSGRELEKETVDYVTELLATTVPGVELGSRSRVATALLRIQSVHLDRAKRQLRVENPPRVVMKPSPI